MSNSYFQFKKFRINQDKSAMKVCTDSCILGAYTDPKDALVILDIGTGTGLLSLMLAQRFQGNIDAVEIEENAFKQAEENINASPWSKRIHLYHQSIQDYAKTCNERYDLIISNPPFYTSYLKSPDIKKNVAHHSEELSLTELNQAITKLLSDNGKFYILLPETEFNKFISIASSSALFPQRILYIKDRPGSAIFRVIGIFSNDKKNKIEYNDLIIKDSSGQYSNEFKNLLRDYYLHL